MYIINSGEEMGQTDSSFSSYWKSVWPPQVYAGLVGMWKIAACYPYTTFRRIFVGVLRSLVVLLTQVLGHVVGTHVRVCSHQRWSKVASRGGGTLQSRPSKLWTLKRCLRQIFSSSPWMAILPAWSLRNNRNCGCGCYISDSILLVVLIPVGRAI